MIRLLLNEYYKWSTLDIFHATIGMCTVVLSMVVFTEPAIMTLTAILMTLTYFFIKVKSRFAYALNALTTVSIGYLLVSLGISISGYVYLIFLTPVAMFFAWYIYANQIYPEDYEDHITNGGFLSNKSFMIYIIIMALVIGGVGYLSMLYSVTIYPFLDISIVTLFITSISLVYMSKYEHTITYTIMDMLNLLMWVITFMSMGIGFSMIIVTLLTFGRSRLLLVWWVAKTFKVEIDEDRRLRIQMKNEEPIDEEPVDNSEDREE